MRKVAIVLGTTIALALTAVSHAQRPAGITAEVTATAPPGNLGPYEDRIAVEDVMARYVWAVDSLDADAYVAVFTDAAVIDSNGSISKGHGDIRKIVTNLMQRRDDNRAKGLATGNLYHVISNVRITFPTPGEAVHQSYWQTVRRDKDGRMTAPPQASVPLPREQLEATRGDSLPILTSMGKLYP